MASCMRLSMDCLLCVFRDVETQTKTDRQSNVPKPQVFLAGLRGARLSEPTDMTKVDLTLSVNQN